MTPKDPNEYPELYRAAPDASGLDRRVMEVARSLHSSGWREEAERVVVSMAYVREGVGSPLDIGERPSEVYDALMTVADHAKAIADIIARTFPDDLALRRDSD